MTREHGTDDPFTAARRHVHVDENDIGRAFPDHLDGGIDLRGLTDDLDTVAELAAHAAAEQVVVVDQEHARTRLAAHDATRGIVSSTSVPVAGRERMTAFPP